jgi:hypothetical protein
MNLEAPPFANTCQPRIPISPDSLENPPAQYRPWPLFVFNEEHEGEMGEPRVTALLEKLCATGFGGIYIHPRPGMLTEYLSPRWFKLVRYTIKECCRLGMIPALYDENSYPSGFAGGQVPANNPELRSRYIEPIQGTGSALPRGTISVYAFDQNRPGKGLDPNKIENTTSWIAFVLRDMEGEPFLAEGPYVSLLDPLATEEFLECTHAAYKKNLSQAEWDALGGIFTDEPHLPGTSLGNWSPGLHFSHRVLAAFQKKFGYDLLQFLPDLYFDSDTSAATRFDFYELLHFMWYESWAIPLSNWCCENSIQLTGHYIEHDWPAPYATPGQMHLLSRLDCPGTDFLECFALLGHGFYDLQGFESKNPGEEPHALYCLRQADSVSRQYGKRRTMNECWGAGGHDSSPADWLRIGRYLIIHGANHLVPHHCFQTLSGMRKMDHPMFLSDQSTFFDQLKPLNDELARLSMVCAEGHTQNRILLLDVLTSGYILARKQDAIEPSGEFTTEEQPFAGPLRSLLPLRRSAERLSQDLSNGLFDFDIADEYIVEEVGSVNGDGQLRVGEACYTVLVIPDGCINLRNQTVTLLNKWLEKGGCVYSCHKGEILVDGRRFDSRPQEWARTHPNAFRSFSSNEELLNALQKKAPPILTFQDSIPNGTAIRNLTDENGQQIAIIVNSHPNEALCGMPEFTSCPSSVNLYRPENHTFEELKKGDILHLKPTAAAVLFLSNSESNPSPTDFPKKNPTKLPKARLQFLQAKRLDENVLVIDHCQLRTGTSQTDTISVFRANKLYWAQQGISGNGWFMRVQHHDNILKREKFPVYSGSSEIHYTANFDSAVIGNPIDLVVERPEQWEIFFNDQILDFSPSSSWRDPRLRRIRINKYVQTGLNRICLKSPQFSIRQEICPIYFVGSFSLQPMQVGFNIRKSSTFDPNIPWPIQGMPFYDGRVEYFFSVGNAPQQLSIPRTAWLGATLELIHGERREIAYGPDIEWILYPKDGDELSLILTGLPKNLFGPWHHPEKPRKRALPAYWKTECSSTWKAPPGDKYDCLPLGLRVDQLLAIS